MNLSLKLVIVAATTATIIADVAPEEPLLRGFKEDRELVLPPPSYPGPPPCCDSNPSNQCYWWHVNPGIIYSPQCAPKGASNECPASMTSCGPSGGPSLNYNKVRVTVNGYNKGCVKKIKDLLKDDIGEWYNYGNGYSSSANTPDDTAGDSLEELNADKIA